MVGTLAIVPSTREARPPRLDPIGTIVSAGALSALVYAIIEGPERGWGDGLTVAALAAGVLGIAAFVLWELRRREPMLDPRYFLRRGFGAGSLSITVQFFAAFGSSSSRCRTCSSCRATRRCARRPPCCRWRCS